MSVPRANQTKTMAQSHQTLFPPYEGGSGDETKDGPNTYMMAAAVLTCMKMPVFACFKPLFGYSLVCDIQPFASNIGSNLVWS